MPVQTCSPSGRSLCLQLLATLPLLFLPYAHGYNNGLGRCCAARYYREPSVCACWGRVVFTVSGHRARGPHVDAVLPCGAEHIRFSLPHGHACGLRVGRLPPMGWNTWCTDDACGLRDICTAKEVMSVADAIVSEGLDKLGYTYLVGSCVPDPGRLRVRETPPRGSVLSNLEPALSLWPGHNAA